MRPCSVRGSLCLRAEKGANQAVAAARLGADVTMIGRVGKDAFGSGLLEIMEQEQVHTAYISQSESQATGVASIVVDGAGENRIIVVPGANVEMKPEDIEALETVISGAGIVVMQLETDLAMCESAAVMAFRHGIPVILNPAPAQPLSDELLHHVTYLTPNETEAGILAGISVESVEDAERAARIMLQKRSPAHDCNAGLQRGINRGCCRKPACPGVPGAGGRYGGSR
ncbi:PfkB family carbohydrate kinase [Paenibacillus rhizoplanae]